MDALQDGLRSLAQRLQLPVAVGGGGASAAGDEAPLGATLVAKSEGQWREVQTRLSESLLHSKATADKLARFQEQTRAALTTWDQFERELAQLPQVVAAAAAADAAVQRVCRDVELLETALDALQLQRHERALATQAAEAEAARKEFRATKEKELRARMAAFDAARQSEQSQRAAERESAFQSEFDRAVADYKRGELPTPVRKSSGSDKRRRRKGKKGSPRKPRSPDKGGAAVATESGANEEDDDSREESGAEGTDSAVGDFFQKDALRDPKDVEALEAFLSDPKDAAAAAAATATAAAAAAAAPAAAPAPAQDSGSDSEPVARPRVRPVE